MLDPSHSGSSKKRESLWTRLAAGLHGAPEDRNPRESSISPQSRYQRLFGRVPIGLYLSSPDGTIIDANPAMVEMLGYPDLNSLLEVNAFDIFADREDRRSQVARLEDEVTVRGYEVQLRRHDGSLIWALDYAHAVKDKRGRVMFYEGALEDITERKQAREALRASNEKLRAIIEGSPLAIVSHDLDGVVLTWNRAAERIFGWTAEEALGKPVPFIPEGESHVFKRLMKQVAGGKSLTETELRRRRRDGSVAWVSVSAGPLRDVGGNVVGILAVIADISKRKQAEQTQRRLAEILEATPDLVGIATVDGQGIYLNPSGRAMVGIPPKEEMSPFPIWEYHPPKHGARIRDEALPSAIRNGTWSGEVVFRAQDGHEIPTSLVMIAHRTAGGEVDHVSVVARDLTEQKALEERVRQAQTMDAIGRLAGGIAHDFNNLLTAIIGHSDLLLRHVEEEQVREDVKAIKTAGQRAAALTSQLLAFGRRQILQLRLLDLNAVVADLGSRLKTMVGEHIELITVLDGKLAPVRADPVQLDEIISALVENACEAMPNGGRLTIETANTVLSQEAAEPLGLAGPGRYAVLSVVDTGTGMDEQTLARIFEPFFSTKREVKGTGLGLATVYGIIKQSGGDIWVQSEPGSGTTVKIFLPAATGDRERAAPAAVVQDAPTSGPATILLVEDEPAVLSLAGRVLKAQGYAVLEAQDGADALATQEKHDGAIDLLITDVVMPRLGGPELAERMRQSRPHLPVIYMSGYTENKTVRDMIADKSIPFLQKPFTPMALAGITQRVLSEAYGERSSEGQ